MKPTTKLATENSADRSAGGRVNYHATSHRAFGKNLTLSIILGVIALLILVRIMPTHVDPVIKLVISKNKTSITNIHQARNIEFSKEVMVDKIDLADKNRFRHAELGDLGYGNDFFVDINRDFTVKKSGKYRFNVSSDDGFSLSIDGKRLCEHLRDRPLTLQSCPINLAEGTHQFVLSYFQGFGNAGLVVEYFNADDKKSFLFGEDSKYITFK